MTVAVRSDWLEENSGLLGEAVDWSSLPKAAICLMETRLAAAVFRRRWRLLVHWRRHNLPRRPQPPCADIPAHNVRSSAKRRSTTTVDDIAVHSDLPRSMPVLQEEVAILRAFLAHEINRILFGDE